MCAYLVWPINLLTGDTSEGSSASEYRVKPSGTFQIKTYVGLAMLTLELAFRLTFPSSEPEAIRESLNGLLHLS